MLASSAPTTRCGGRTTLARAAAEPGRPGRDRAARPQLPANSAVAVGADDTIWVAGGGKLLGLPEGAATPGHQPAAVMQATDPMQVTTVGNVPVVADATTRTLYLPDSGHTDGRCRPR